MDMVDILSILPPSAPPIRIEIPLTGFSRVYKFCAALKEVGWPTDLNAGVVSDACRRIMTLLDVRPVGSFLATISP